MRKRVVLPTLLVLGISSCSLHSWLVADSSGTGSSYVPLPPPTEEEKQQRIRIARNSILARTRRHPDKPRDERGDAIWMGIDLTDVPKELILHRYVDSDQELARRADTSAVGMDGIRAGRLPSPPPIGRDLDLKTAMPWQQATYMTTGGLGGQNATLMTYHTAATDADALRFIDQQVEVLKKRFDVDPHSKAMRSLDGRSTVLLMDFAESREDPTRLASRMIRKITIIRNNAKTFMAVELRRMYENRT